MCCQQQRQQFDSATCFSKMEGKTPFSSLESLAPLRIIRELFNCGDLRARDYFSKGTVTAASVRDDIQISDARTTTCEKRGSTRYATRAPGSVTKRRAHAHAFSRSLSSARPPFVMFRPNIFLPSFPVHKVPLEFGRHAQVASLRSTSLRASASPNSLFSHSPSRTASSS